MANAPPPLDPEDATRSERVVDRLRAAAGPSGTLPFDRFMEIALYEAGIGFYERVRSPLGPEGDFYTAAHVSPLFAASVAARIRAVRAALGSPGPFRIVELGPGDGTLAAGVVAALASDPPGIEYVLVDRSRARLREAEERIRREASPIPVRRSASVGVLGPFAGVVLANEFLDAQPARRLCWDGSSWQEIGVRIRDGRIRAVELPLDRPIPGLPKPPPEVPGQVYEFSPAGERTVREIADHLSGGEAIVIDYGLSEDALLRGHPGGTLAAVRDHRFLPDPLEAPGTADLSVFVNFDRVRAVAKESGLVEVAYRSQAEALGDWGFPQLLDTALRTSSTAEEKVRLQLAAKNLLFGFERFRVLELAPAGTAGLLARVT